MYKHWFLQLISCLAYQQVLWLRRAGSVVARSDWLASSRSPADSRKAAWPHLIRQIEKIPSHCTNMPPTYKCFLSVSGVCVVLEVPTDFGLISYAFIQRRKLGFCAKLECGWKHSLIKQFPSNKSKKTKSSLPKKTGAKYKKKNEFAAAREDIVGLFLI